MLAIARGVMADPELLLVDEPSLGLAPNTTMAVFEALMELRKHGLTILLVEQERPSDLRRHRPGYVIENGRIVLAGMSRDLADNKHVQSAYLGV